MIITCIESSRKRFRIYIDEQLEFSLYANDLVKFDLHEEGQVSQEIIDEIRNMLYKRGLLYSYNLLARRNYGSHELLARLIRAEYPTELASEILRQLLERGFINDSDYLDRYIESMKERKNAHAIKSELLSKGFSRNLIEEKLSSVEINETDMAKKLFDKKLRGISEPTKKDMQRVYRYLLSKGFQNETVARLFDKMDNE